MISENYAVLGGEDVLFRENPRWIGAGGRGNGRTIRQSTSRVLEDSDAGG